MLRLTQILWRRGSRRGWCIRAAGITIKSETFQFPVPGLSPGQRASSVPYARRNVRLNMSHPYAGASLEVRLTEPSVDLATLVECLADAVAPPAAPNAVRPHQRWPLFAWSASTCGGVLAIDTRAVLSRLTTSPSAFQRLKPGSGAGFLRDAPVPRRRTNGHLGGRIAEGTGGQLRRAVDRLIGLIDAELDKSEHPDSGLAELAALAPEDVLRGIGNRVDCDVADGMAGRTRLHRTLLEPVQPTQESRRDEVARTMTAIEELVGERTDHFEHMAIAIAELLRQEEYSERQVAIALASYRQQIALPDSQVARFFDFLEDEALVRIRLHVTYRLMDAIADAAAGRLGTRDAKDMRALITYVHRARALFMALGSGEGEDVYLNLASEYGDQANFSLSDEVGLVGFSGCLPVWPESVAQIFEHQRRATDQPASVNTVREVSYRFRINGINPEDRRTAYVSRLTRIREALLANPEPHRVRRNLAELVFLAAVVPTEAREEMNEAASAADALQTARLVAQRIEHGRREAIDETLTMLEGQASRVDIVSRALITVLKAGGAAVTERFDGRTWEYFVNVNRRLVNLDRIADSLDRPLATDESPSREMLAFFKCIRITPDRSLPSSLFSLPVRIRLGERSLMSSGVTATGSIARAPQPRLVQVVWRPFATTVGRDQASKAPQGPSPDAWQAPTYVELQYDLAAIRRNQDAKRADPEESEQLLAAFRTAFTVLCYVALQRVLSRARQATGLSGRGDLGVSMLRMHAEKANSDPLSGSPALFAASQAVETALARDFDVHMQGMVLEEPMPFEKRHGVFHALFAGFPLVIERRTPKSEPHTMEQTLGLVTFGSRPCTSTGEQPGDNLFTARTYRAQAVTEPFSGYRVWCDAVRTEIREAREGEAVPPTVTEEILRLYDLGCRHVLLLAHRYGGRRIGGSVRYQLHDHSGTLPALAAAHPDLFVYPLVRDTFPVTRMRRRDVDNEDAFEILAPDEHLAGGALGGGELRRDCTPIYSLATLYVIGEASKPQSGVSTYFLLRNEGGISIEQAERMQANLLLTSGPTAGLRGDLIAVLRGVHYLEAERPPSRDHFFQPVLDPYGWLAPDSRGNAGEIVVRTSRRRAGTVVLSLTAILEHVSRALHAQPGADGQP